MQQKSNGLNQEPTPEHPATVPPDTVQHKESDQTTYRHPTQSESRANSVEKQTQNQPV